MATLRHLLLLVTPGTGIDDLNRLYDALAAIVAQRAPPTNTRHSTTTSHSDNGGGSPFGQVRAQGCRAAPSGDWTGMGGNHFEYSPDAPVIAAVITAKIIDYLIGMRQHAAVLKRRNGFGFQP
jgi:hypothetical protein